MYHLLKNYLLHELNADAKASSCVSVFHIIVAVTVSHLDLISMLKQYFEYEEWIFNFDF